MLPVQPKCPARIPRQSARRPPSPEPTSPSPFDEAATGTYNRVIVVEVWGTTLPRRVLYFGSPFVPASGEGPLQWGPVNLVRCESKQP